MIVTLKPGERLQVFAPPGGRLLDYVAYRGARWAGADADQIDIVAPDAPAPSKLPAAPGPRYDDQPGRVTPEIPAPDSLGG